MLRGAFARLLTAAAMASTAAPSARAQSLADAARRAEEQRQQSHPDVPSFTDRDLAPAAGVATGNREAMSLVLTLPLLQQYSSARTAILRAMVQSPDMTRRMLGAIGRGARQGVEGLEREYGMIPAAVDAIRAGGLAVHDYAVTEVTFMAAVGVLAGKLQMTGAPAGTLGGNVEFLKHHQQEVATLWKDASVLEERIARQVGTPN